MISKDLWRNIYNTVFSIYLPPDPIIEKIVLNHKGIKKEFSSCVELITYISTTMNTEILNTDLRFFLKDDSLYKDNKKYYDNLCRKLKKVV